MILSVITVYKSFTYVDLSSSLALLFVAHLGLLRLGPAALLSLQNNPLWQKGWSDVGGHYLSNGYAEA